MTFTSEEIQAMNQGKGKPKPQGFTPAPKSDPCGISKGARPTTKLTTKAELCWILNISVEEFEVYCKQWSLVIEDSYVPSQVEYYRDRLGAKARSTTPAPSAPSTAIPTARTNALALSAQSHDAMSALQGAGLGNAAAYVQRKQMERNAVVEKVSDAIAYLSDPNVLEADIMSAAAAKVAACSNAWGYTEPIVDFDTLFALPATSQHLLGGT